jgi:hypothetical protein
MKTTSPVSSIEDRAGLAPNASWPSSKPLVHFASRPVHRDSRRR